MGGSNQEIYLFLGGKKCSDSTLIQLTNVIMFMIYTKIYFLELSKIVYYLGIKHKNGNNFDYSF